MMFNGLLVSGDSDNSDGKNDSSGACSLMDSATGSCEANAQASYYHNKLVSTLQILQNREETIRVQAESLAVAEERISALTERAAELRRDLERKSKEEVEQQSDMMNTLQSNLSVIEDLYRECFYETAKQEDLIDLLRKSYLDVRLMDKQKADQIGRLQNVINAQKLSLDKCQEIALEVDTLKMELSNFLGSPTSTNNDSGMWERCEESFATAPEVHEELQEVMEQLLRLRELLNDPCTCGLQNEIRRLKQKNEALQSETTELWQRNSELEKQLQAKSETKDNLEKKYKEEVKTREEQLKCVRRELAIMLESSKDQAITCEQLTMQLRQTEELLADKSEELVRMQQQCDTQQETIDELRDEAKRTEELYKENCKLRGEVSSLSAQAAQWREQLAASGRRVRKLETKLRQAIDCYSEKENNASELQLQLEQAHARGAALCGDVRRVLCALRHWARRSRDARREQENTIKEKDEVIAALQNRLQSRADNDMPCLCTGAAQEPPRSASSRRASCSRLEAGRPQFLTTNENEMATCSSAPTPPRRLFRKKPPYGVTSCKGTRWFCEATQQHPERHDASQDPRDSYCEMPEPTTTSTMGNVSPTDELFRRMENLSDALADGYRRWTKSDAR
ncbi:unnamed protein product [Arctia plantaginis]|uniref:Uncharacterized protein n=1 Tax=Arctia plantaginis TaxID=874455 RepID=A0A8S0ZIN9_ARCPL|nr:unnamed protein product [Arctia plantaginis]